MVAKIQHLKIRDVAEVQHIYKWIDLKRNVKYSI